MHLFTGGKKYFFAVFYHFIEQVLFVLNRKTEKTGKLIEKESVTAALIVKKNRNTKFLNRMSIVQMFAFQLLGTLMYM
jgi:hypothetical protein